MQSYTLNSLISSTPLSSPRSSEFARAGAEHGLDHAALVGRIMELALARYSR